MWLDPEKPGRMKKGVNEKRQKGKMGRRKLDPVTGHGPQVWASDALKQADCKG